MNIVNIIGNLTKDVDVRYTTGNEQKAITRFTVAVNDGYGDDKRTSFIPVVVFGKQAENCEKYLSKGSKVGVTGKLQTGSYEKDGRTIYTTDVIANRVEFLSSNGEKHAENANNGVTSGGFANTDGGFMALTDDDIPF